MRNGYELFRFRGVAVRVHFMFVLLAVLMILMSMAEGGSPATVGLRLLAPFILLATVLVHELGHALAAEKLGVSVLDVVLTPFGGVARIHGKLENPVHEMAIAAAGPGVNLLVAGLCVAAMAATGRLEALDWSRTVELSPDNPAFSGGDPWAMILTFNLLLGFLNLLPAFPMDGGRILRGALALQWGRLLATRFACRLGSWMALALVLMPFWLDGVGWFPGLVMGGFLFFAGLKERLLVEAHEGVFKTGQFGFRAFGAGFPPDGAAAPGGDAGPAADGFEDAPQGFIDVEGDSRVLDDDREDRS